MDNTVIMHIVGNRPQFIKLAPVSNELHRRGYKDVIIHTGQHYDENMSDIFFKELGIEKPIENLEVGSGSHAEITAKAMIGVEKVCMKYQPSVVVLYGDTDSTLAAALACNKLNIPIAHVEAGPRTYERSNPEETNRVVDHISDIFLETSEKGIKNNLLEKYDIEKDNYILMTWHRQENTDKKGRIEKILSFLERITDCKILYPIHPHTKKVLGEYDL